MSNGVIAIEASMALFKAEASLTFFTKIMNMISDYAEITIEFQGEDYFLETSMGRAFVNQKGASYKIIIKGKPLVCKYVLEKLTGFDPNDLDYEKQIVSGEKNIVEIIEKKVVGIQKGNNYAVAEAINITWKEFLKDLFSKKNTIELSKFGDNYELLKYWFFYKKETGSKLSITVSGKPNFIRASIDHISRFWGLQ